MAQAVRVQVPPRVLLLERQQKYWLEQVWGKDAQAVFMPMPCAAFAGGLHGALQALARLRRRLAVGAVGARGAVRLS